MKYEIMQDWVSALRSGKFKQGTGALCKLTRTILEDGEFPRFENEEYSYCCLGVLCTLEGGSEFDNQSEEMEYATSVELAYEGATELTPIEVQAWAGISEAGNLPDNVELRTFATSLGVSPSESLTLAVLNDKGATFTQIADIIEKYWEELA